MDEAGVVVRTLNVQEVFACGRQAMKGASLLIVWAPSRYQRQYADSKMGKACVVRGSM
jgi:hypothetical protein